MKTTVAFFGALAGVAGVVGLYFGLGIGWLGLAIVIGVTLVSYILVHHTATTGFGEFMRGWLIGFNAGLNGFLGAVVYALLLGPAGVAVGVLLGVLNFLAVFPVISQGEVFQGFLGWLCLLQPMSYLIAGLGVVFYLTNLILHPVALITGTKFLRVLGLRVDWKTGTFFQRGGLFSNLNPVHTAYNMGNFSFVDKKTPTKTSAKTPDWHIEHEAGHTLNLATFGSLFHLIGAFNEVVLGTGADDFAERLAESNNPATSQTNIIAMWT